MARSGLNVRILVVYVAGRGISCRILQCTASRRCACIRVRAHLRSRARGLFVATCKLAGVYQHRSKSVFGPPNMGLIRCGYVAAAAMMGMRKGRRPPAGGRRPS